MANTVSDLDDHTPAGEWSGAHASGLLATRRGPRKRPLAELLELTADDTLFAEHTDGHRLLVDRQALARQLGITRQSLWGRIKRLLEDGLAAEHGRDLILHTDRIRQRVAPTVVALPTPATRRFHAQMTTRYTAAAAADGTVAYIRPDGRPATLREMSDQMGWGSAGTAHHHMRRLPTELEHPEPSPSDTDTTLTAAARALDSATELLAAARNSGHHDLIKAATRFADELMRATTKGLTGRDVSIDARSQSRHGVAFRDDQRDANATTTRSNQGFGSGLDGDSIPPIHNQDNAPEKRDGQRDPQRDSGIDHETDAANAADQDDVGPALWAAGEWSELIAPLEKAWYGKHRQRLAAVSSRTIERARRRPRAAIAHAINHLTDQVNAGLEIRDAAAILGAAIRDGNPDYFPDTSPRDDTDIAEQYLADTAHQLATDAATQANGDLHVAAYLVILGAGADDDLLARAVASARTRLSDPEHKFLTHVVDQLDATRAQILARNLTDEDPR